jgi:hypothetical protein
MLQLERGDRARSTRTALRTGSGLTSAPARSTRCGCARTPTSSSSTTTSDRPCSAAAIRCRTVVFGRDFHQHVPALLCKSAVAPIVAFTRPLRRAARFRLKILSADPFY